MSAYLDERIHSAGICRVLVRRTESALDAVASSLRNVRNRTDGHHKETLNLQPGTTGARLEITSRGAVSPMKYYRCYLLTDEGHIARAEILKCADEADAARQCRDLVPPGNYAGAEV